MTASQAQSPYRDTVSPGSRSTAKAPSPFHLLIASSTTLSPSDDPVPGRAGPRSATYWTKDSELAAYRIEGSGPLIPYDEHRAVGVRGQKLAHRTEEHACKFPRPRLPTTMSEAVFDCSVSTGAG